MALTHSSPKSSPNSQNDSPMSSDGARIFYYSIAEGSLCQRRLTRQRRLRYLSDHELGTSRLHERSRSSPTSPESARKLRSPPDREHWSFSAVPQPLPLPESPYAQRVNALGSRKDSEQTSSNPTKSSAKQNRKRFSSQDANGDRSFAGVSNSPMFNFPIVSNAGEIILCSNNLRDDDNFDRIRNHPIEPFEPLKLRASGPSKSAPTSPATSPQRSPPSDISRFFLAPLDGGGNKATRKALQLVVKPTKSLTATNKANGEIPAQPLPLPLPPATHCAPPQIHHGAELPVLSPPAMTTVKGQWRKGKLIGRGTFGSVYLGIHIETGALCAMKEVDLIPDDPKSAECIKQLEQEIRVLSQLKHPNIVQYYGSEIVDDHFYIYLEYVYPGSINKYVREHCSTITETVVRNFTRHILSGLAYLHSTKTIHRDVKGANLLVDSSGVVKLADFGTAKHLTGQNYDLSLKGSPYWMAPEVIKAAMQKNTSSSLAFAVDIWSLGCTIIEMLNGKPPWSEFTPPQAMFNVLNKTPPIPKTLSSEGKDFLYCCFQRNPADRPSAAKLLEHAFVRNLHPQGMSPTSHTSIVNMMEKLHTQRDHGKDKFDFMSVRARIANGSPPYCGNASSPWTLSL